MGISLFKANYGYELTTSLTLKQVKKINPKAKERAKKFMNLYKNFYKITKLVQEQIKKYYNFKKSKKLNFKKGDKAQLLHKNFKNKRLSKKLDYVKIKLFKIL